MSAVSNKRVMDAMGDGRIVIEPFNPDYLSTSSYDVCLGQYYYREQRPEFDANVFNIYNQEHVQRIWGAPQEAMLVQRQAKYLASGFLPSDRVILLAPGETILAHTEEFIGGRIDVTTMMKARSSLGRSFITVCKCAGWGDVGYINRWTMEITNVSAHYHIPLLAGERIAQIVFFDCPETTGDYALKGNYQTTTDIAELRANWNPAAMLPRTKRNTGVVKGK